MKTKLFLVLSAAFLAAPLSAESFIGLSGTGAFPQGGASAVSRSGGAALRAGAYLTELAALEGTLGIQHRAVTLGADVLVHAAAWSLYDRFFGYSAFDPFVTVGVKGWIGDPRGTLGPTAGFGAFYHLSDNWSIRVDSEATLGLDRRVEMIYTLAAGLHYAF